MQDGAGTLLTSAGLPGGREQALLLWTVFGAIAAAVPVALVMTISSALYFTAQPMDWVHVLIPAERCAIHFAAAWWG